MKTIRPQILTVCSAGIFIWITCCVFNVNAELGLQTVQPLFNLTSNTTDPNGFMLNPTWSGGVPDPGDKIRCPNPDFSGPQCSTQTTTTDSGGPLSLGTCLVNLEPNRIPGHVNWTEVTYEGIICFGSYNSMSDGDYTFEFSPKGGAGLTTKRSTIHAEFDSYETVDQFQTVVWRRFRNYLQGNPPNKNAAKVLVDGSRAIITGLMGLDTEHGGYSELHPIYMLAIETSPDPQDNVWMIFIRTWGNQGWCSKQRHPISRALSDFKLLLPVIPGSHPTQAKATDF